ncbi:uncharacterized protein LOC106164628 [Lingula anatina]|uniref:Uncharacterized protein LOC106164628 n=1 Tax=Lingula anatina TaxID=7574 RepID=A0A1S3IKK1_LINAN|nr:uncharacterized protein LOC106164628 [Lingula anatina]|eukprot:XP_013398049.1 uncharacterized protein LOC106164628 [Lingula anatina]
MALFMVRTILTLVSLLCGAREVVGCGEGYIDPTISENIQYAEAVVYGEVLARYPATDTGLSYTVTLETHCIFKGPRVNGLINITKTGHIPGWCYETNFQENSWYFVFLQEEGSQWVPSEVPVISNDVRKVQEVLGSCGLSAENLHPVGDKTDSKYKCPQVDEKTCLVESTTQANKSSAGVTPRPSTKAGSYQKQSQLPEGNAGVSVPIFVVSLFLVALFTMLCVLTVLFLLRHRFVKYYTDHFKLQKLNEDPMPSALSGTFQAN